MSKSNLVVKSNRLNQAFQTLSLSELHIMQLAIVDARETGTGLSTDTPLRIDAIRYAEVFDTTRQNAYQRMKDAEETLFNRRFSFYDESGCLVKSRWISQVRYLNNEGAMEIVLTPAVVQGISRIDGVKEFFTQYLLSQTAKLDSVYSARLYELLIQWKSTGIMPKVELTKLREQLGLGVDEYKQMSDFKKRVLELAINEINEKTDITVSYEQHKKGRVIDGFSFKLKPKEKDKKEISGRDPKTVDWVSGVSDDEIKGMTPSQAFYYADQLYQIHAIVGGWTDCPKHDDAKNKLIYRLQQPEYVRKYMKYLLECKKPFDPKTVGFK